MWQLELEIAGRSLNRVWKDATLYATREAALEALAAWRSENTLPGVERYGRPVRVAAPQEVA